MCIDVLGICPINGWMDSKMHSAMNPIVLWSLKTTC